MAQWKFYPGIVSVAAMCLGLASGQSRPVSRKGVPAKGNRVTLQGKIFAITRGGDLKPARMASIYVLPAGSDLEKQIIALVNEDNEAEQKRKQEHLSNRLKQMTNPDDDGFSEQLAGAVGVIRCRKAQVDMSQAIVQAVENKMILAQAEADEEGVFKITGLKPGTYTVLAQGSAGINDAYWLTSGVNPAQKPEPLKLSNPIHSCAPQP